MKITLGNFIALVREPIKAMDKANPGSAGMLEASVEVFESMHEDDIGEEHHIGFLVTELMSTLSEHQEDRIEELEEDLKSLENKLDEGVNEIDEIISRLEETKSDMERDR